MLFENTLITGSDGQLGLCLRQVFEKHPLQGKIIFTDVNELDITNEKAVLDFAQEQEIGFIVNLAAYTAVDKAESDIMKAFKINTIGVENLVKAAQLNHAFLIQISTDYVFGGESENRHTPFLPDEPTHPVSVYGSSKALAEEIICERLERAAIIRTAWLYSPYCKNFFKTMLQLGETKPELKVVADQIGSPTYAMDLARAIVTILEQSEKVTKPEIFHFTNESTGISWCEFAQKIMEIGQRKCIVKPCTTAEYPTPAHRPAYSLLDLNKIKQYFDIQIPSWEKSLQECYKIHQNL